MGSRGVKSSQAAGTHTDSTMCIQINQEGKQDALLTQFSLFSITQSE